MNELAMSSLNRVSSALKSMYQMRRNKIYQFRPKVQLELELGPFVIKTVTKVSELKEALSLRYQVFFREMIGVKRALGVDVDEFDALCDHLVILEKRTSRVVGTYRMNCSTYSDQFYSAREFNLKRIMDKAEPKIELGRACIHKDFRKGIVISLLWRGIAEYMAASEGQILFGCASVKTQNPREAALLHRYFFEEHRLSPEFFCPPTLAFSMPHLDLWMQNFKTALTFEQRQEAEALVPPLFRAYLKIGAFVGGEPAWDSEFKCIDFLTILRREDLNKVLWKKYKLNSAPDGESSFSS